MGFHVTSNMEDDQPRQLAVVDSMVFCIEEQKRRRRRSEILAEKTVRIMQHLLADTSRSAPSHGLLGTSIRRQPDTEL